MDARIDLTENRDFRNKQKSLKDLALELRGYNKNIPWDFSKIYREENSNPHELVLTGDKKDREKKKEWLSYERGLVCECCGYVAKMSWKIRYGLCEKCNKHDEEESSRLWGNYMRREDRFRERIDRLTVLDMRDLDGLMQDAL